MFKDKYAVAKVKELIKNYGVRTVVETGTWQGEGALGFSSLMDNVYTIEINLDYFKESQENIKRAGYNQLGVTSIYVKGTKKITFLLGNSPEVMESIIEWLEEPILFFLDAHWLEYWPLLDELKVIRRRPNSLIIIDDFKVPGKPFGYDTYHGKRLDWNLLNEHLAAINPDYRIFFNKEASGDYRGILYAVPRTDKTEPGELEWTMEKYEEAYQKLIKADLPGEMAGHIVIQEET